MTDAGTPPDLQCPSAIASSPPADATAGGVGPGREPADDSGAAVAEPEALPPLVARATLGGGLMGLANLVPGISGGTMLLAAGVYPRFIIAVGEVTTMRFRRVSLATLLPVLVGAAAAILLLAGVVKDLVVDHRWVMYSLFIGLTLGGVPVVWRLAGRPTAATWLGAVAGLGAMVALALAQPAGLGGGEQDSFVMMLLAGAAGAAAMILPGVSGGYLLLVLGVYVPILAGIAMLKDALGTRDVDTLMHLGLTLILPVGLGVLIGVVAVSNLLRWLLQRYEKATLGVLLGLLIGAVAGLWPFQRSIEITEGLVVKGRTVTAVQQADDRVVWIYADSTGMLEPEHVEAEELPTEYFRPTAIQVFGALGLIGVGFLATMAVDRVGRAKTRS